MSRRQFTKARILIVDDEPASVEVLRRLLERGGFTRGSYTTTDPREAVAMYVEHRPDLILLDLHMPHLDGLQVMDALNEIIEATYLPDPDAHRRRLGGGQEQGAVARGQGLSEQAVHER